MTSLNQAMDPAVEREFWENWFKNIALLIAGTGASCMAFFNIRCWKRAILITSAMVAVPVALSVGSHVLERGGIYEWWQLWQAVAQLFIERGEGGLFAIRVYHLLVWPAMHIALMAVVACLWAIRPKVNHVEG